MPTLQIYGLILLAVVLVGCNKPAVAPSVAPGILATVGERKIQVADWDAEVARRIASNQKLPAKDQLLDELISREAMLSRVREIGLDQNAEIRRRYENMLIAELKDRELRPRLETATVSEADIRATGQQRMREQPAQIRLAILQLTAGPRVSDGKRSQIAARLAEAREKTLQLPPGEKGFGGIAVDYSDDQAARYNGGDKGWFDVGRTNYALATEVLQAAAKLQKVGDVSEVIRTDRGFQLVRLMDRREAGGLSLSELGPVMHDKLLAKERKRIEAEFATDTRAKVRIEINRQTFDALRLEHSSPTGKVESIPPAVP